MKLENIIRGAVLVGAIGVVSLVSGCREIKDLLPEREVIVTVPGPTNYKITRRRVEELYSSPDGKYALIELEDSDVLKKAAIFNTQTGERVLLHDLVQIPGARKNHMFYRENVLMGDSFFVENYDVDNGGTTNQAARILDLLGNQIEQFEDSSNQYAVMGIKEDCVILQSNDGSQNELSLIFPNQPSKNFELKDAATHYRFDYRNDGLRGFTNDNIVVRVDTVGEQFFKILDTKTNQTVADIKATGEQSWFEMSLDNDNLIYQAFDNNTAEYHLRKHNVTTGNTQTLKTGLVSFHIEEISEDKKNIMIEVNDNGVREYTIINIDSGNELKLDADVVEEIETIDGDKVVSMYHNKTKSDWEVAHIDLGTKAITIIGEVLDYVKANSKGKGAGVEVEINTSPHEKSLFLRPNGTTIDLPDRSTIFGWNGDELIYSVDLGSDEKIMALDANTEQTRELYLEPNADLRHLATVGDEIYFTSSPNSTNLPVRLMKYDFKTSQTIEVEVLNGYLDVDWEDGPNQLANLNNQYTGIESLALFNSETGQFHKLD